MHAFEKYLQSARFLVIDDEPVSASAVEISLAAAGHEEIHIVNDPCDALAAFLEYQPDIILLDISMPVMDGFDVLGQIRNNVPPDDYLPVIVITADPMETTRRRALSAGANDFLNKPFGSTELRLRVRNLLQTRFLHLGLREQNRRLGVPIQPHHAVDVERLVGWRHRGGLIPARDRDQTKPRQRRQRLHRRAAGVQRRLTLRPRQVGADGNQNHRRPARTLRLASAARATVSATAPLQGRIAVSFLVKMRGA